MTWEGAPAVVLGSDARAVLAVACAAVLGRGRGPCIVVRASGGEARFASGPATRAARALAAALVADGVPAAAAGRVVRVDIPVDVDARTVIERAVAAGTPVAVARGGAREPRTEHLIAGAALVLAVAEAPGPLDACLRAEFGTRLRLVSPPDPLAAACARAGLAWPAARWRGEDGQAAQLLLAALAAIVIGAGALGLLGAGLRAHAEHQRAADLAALAGARALLDARPRALGPGAAAPLTRAAYLGLARRIATGTGRANGARDIEVDFGAGGLPSRVRVVVRDPIRVPGAGSIASEVVAEAELTAWPGPPLAGDYPGPFALRDGRPMRPDVALAYDRLARAARAAGHRLVVVSGFRSSAEQARLFAARPDPRWVARPGTSLHRLGTELDLGPASAYRWIGASAERYGFVRRYAWEPWHVGLRANAGTTSLGYGEPGVPAYVPSAYRDTIRRAAARHQVGAALLAAQLQQESGFDPSARSAAGALGIAQFVPATAALYGLADPLDPVRAIDAQARLMHDLLRRFGSVPLALAAYNAGPGAVAACGCVPGFTETQAYVARILALVGGGAGAGPPVRLIR